METTKREYIDKQYSLLWERLGCFFSFSNEQFEEGLAKAGGIEVTGKYIAVGHGLCCPKKNINALLDGLDQIKANWKKERQKGEQVRLQWVGIDGWSRPVWKAPDKREYYGSVNELFGQEATEEEVLKKVDTFGLCYMGDHFGCEPMGGDVPDKYYI